MKASSWYSLLLLSIAFVVLSFPIALAEERDKTLEQRRKIEQLERSIAKEEKELEQLKKGKTTAQKRVNMLASQVEKRTALINATNRQINSLTAEVAEASAKVDSLSTALAMLEKSCCEMVRSAYRNYRFNNYLAYIFSASSAAETARRIATLRGATERQGEAMHRIVALREEVTVEKERLDAKRETLAASKKSLDNQRSKLQKDAASARAEVKRMSKKEQVVLRSKKEQEKQLDAAVKELQKLIKGNKTGASIATNMRNLRLPVEGGKVKQYMGNKAEITGKEGAAIIAIYEGKVMDIKRNKMTGKYEVYIAHGEYITLYSNLSAVSVEKGATVPRDGRIGTIGSAVNISTMEVEYRILFGVFAPSGKPEILASSCFKK